MNERESLFESRYPMLVSEGKLRGYWLIAPGVYQPPCGFSMTSDGWACRLPRWHDGPHHMEYERSQVSAPRKRVNGARPKGWPDSCRKCGASDADE